MKIYKIAKQQYRIKIGQKYLFEYHCYEGHDSCDAKLWYHSHQPITVLSMDEPGVGKNEIERGEEGQPAAYRVRFEDGFEYTAMEDEIVESKSDFFRPDPPKPPKQNIDLDKGKNINKKNNIGKDNL